MKTLISAGALALGALLAAAPAQAAITFTLKGMVFGTGGLATGSFVTDDDLTRIESFSIRTSQGFIDGTRTAGMNWVSTEPRFASRITRTGVTFSNDDVGVFAMEFPEITSVGATLSRGYERLNGMTRTINTGFRSATLVGEAAPAASLPEPSSWVAMILGFGLAGAAMRRRRVAVAFA